MKEKIIAFVDRRNHTKDENIRLAIIGLIIVFIIGICLSFLTVSFKLSVADSESKKIETVILEPDNDVIDLSLGGLILHKPLKDYAIVGKEIGDVEILGMNVYEFVTTPFPSFEGLQKAQSFTDSGAVDFLVSKQFVSFSKENLGDAGEDVVKIGATIHDINEQANKTLKKVNGILSTLNTASENLRNTVSEIEDTLNLIDNIVTLFIVLLIAAFVFLFFEKIPKKIPAVTLTVFSGMFIVIGVGIAVVNGIVNSTISDSMEQIADVLRTLIDGAAPGLYDIIMELTGGSGSSLLLKVNICCGAGWWLMTASLVTITVLAYMRLPKKEKDISLDTE